MILGQIFQYIWNKGCYYIQSWTEEPDRRTEGIRNKGIIKLGETLSNWEEEINNIQKYNINNGFVEGKNNKIKVIKRLSYGIKKIDNLKKLIQLRIS